MKSRREKRPLSVVDGSEPPGIPGSFGHGLPRWIDFLLALAGIVVFAPLLVVVAVAVRVSSRGPALFRQQRVGRGGRLFTLYKFRSMRADATGPGVTSAHDERVTAVGRFLRKTKLDELPELFNIVKGDMAIVGPRPEVPEYVDAADPLWQAVLTARPGLTDPVTLRLRNEEALMSRVDDREGFYVSRLQPLKLRGYVDYLAQRTPIGDVRVIVLTFLASLFPELVPAPSVKEITAQMEETVLTDQYRVRVVWRGLLVKTGQLLLDLEVLVAAFALAYLLRFDFSVPSSEVETAIVQLPLVVLIQLLALAAFGIFRFVWRYVGIAELGAFNRAAIVSALPLLALRFLLPDELKLYRVPLSVIFIDTMLAFGGMLAMRVVRRWLHEHGERVDHSMPGIAGELKRAVIVGAGRGGMLAAREIASRGDLGLEARGFVDDDHAKQGSVIQGLRVLGTTEDLPRIVRENAIRQVVVAIAQTPPGELERILEICRTIPVEVLVLPGLYQIIDGSVKVVRDA